MSYAPILSRVEQDIREERARQDVKWGEQNHPDGTGPGVVWGIGGYASEVAYLARAQCKANGPGQDNWLDILREEVAEAFAETDPAKLREQLIQVAAVAVQWIEAIDRRSAAPVRDLLIDPDCASGKCGSCVGGPCEHGCHREVSVSV